MISDHSDDPVTCSQKLGSGGMWTFDNLPKKEMAKLYGFEPDQNWVDHVQRSSLLFSGSGSASWVSSQGLILTNHHVGLDSIAKIGRTIGRDLVQSGFFSLNPGPEMAAPGIDVKELISIADVTSAVLHGVHPGMMDAEVEKLKKSNISRIEKDAQVASHSRFRNGLKAEVVTLYQGGLYHLYQYKQYTDIRLVFAPEASAASFGGDEANFDYPRYGLDVSFFRVYEDGKPVTPDHFFRWSKNGAQENEPVFISGRPGGTNRLFTVHAMKYMRDFSYPLTIELLNQRIQTVRAYSEKGAREKAEAYEELHSLENGIKRLKAELVGVQELDLIEKKAVLEAQLREKTNRDESLRKLGDAWDIIQKATDHRQKLLVDYNFLEGALGFNSKLFQIARTLLRMRAEDAKPNGERLSEFQDARRPSLLRNLHSPAPIQKAFEEAKLAGSLNMWVSRFGAHHPLVEKVMAGRTPEQKASELVANTHLNELEFRNELSENPGKLETTRDSMIELAKLVDESARALRKDFEVNVETAEENGYRKIASLMFSIFGNALPPDGTGTLRFAHGIVKGYEQSGTAIPAWTTLGDTYVQEKLHGARGDWQLPSETWGAAQHRINGNTPYNFVSTLDTIGGNSGSPVFNQGLEIVGINFDSNPHKLKNQRYEYRVGQSRNVSVHSSAILEALRNIYGAGVLADELGH